MSAAYGNDVTAEIRSEIEIELDRPDEEAAMESILEIIDSKFCEDD